MSYNLLSEPIRKYIRNKRWDSLRPIQAAAIDKIISTNSNYILASRTASGKTEAAFLPILSKTNFNKRGVQVLYISPLIALINDQFYRIEDLCKDLEIKVTKWHGEAKRSLKNELIKNPEGVVLITPESIEAMFVNSPYNVYALFENLKYIVIDEIHSFLGVDRGTQLMSLLSRLQEINKNRIVTIGLSATIGNENYIEAKKFTGYTSETKVLLDKTKKETEAKFKYFENNTKELSLDLLKDLYSETNNNKVLIFPNSRGRTEEIAVKLRKLSDRVNGHKNYYSHHSSVDKEIREGIEFFAKNNERFNFCICCTSTLELGIDIGSVDKIVQIDSTHSVSSLVQRIGRSGRKEGEKSYLCLYATNKWSFLQSLACWLLYKADFLEPIKIAVKPYDILLHQMLSIEKQLSGCNRLDLVERLKSNFAFREITEDDINCIIDFSIEKDYLEVLQNDVILGVDGENIVNTREFYSVFKTEVNFKVTNAGRRIGEIPFSPQVRIDENILLAARIWKIRDIDFKGQKIDVVPAPDGKNPIFFGGGGDIDPIVRKEMLRILKCDENYPELNEASSAILQELRYDFNGFPMISISTERPLLIKEKKQILYTFTGTKINRSLSFLFTLVGINNFLVDHTSSIEIDLDLVDFKVLTKQIKDVYSDIDSYLEVALGENEMLLSFSKWGLFLPIKYQCEILKERYFNFEGAIEFMEQTKFLKIQSH